MLPVRTDPEAEAPRRWPSDEKRRLPGKDPDVGKVEGKRRRGRQMRWLDSVIEATNMNLTQLWEAVEDRRSWRVTKEDLWGRKASDMT